MARLTVVRGGTAKAVGFLCQMVAAGKLAAVDFGGEVYALIGDGLCPEAVRLIEDAKGKRSGPPAVLIDPLATVYLIDRRRLPAVLVEHPHLSQDLPRMWGNFSFLRFPLWPQAVGSLVPDHLISYAGHGPVLQAFSFFGDERGWALEGALRTALAQKHPQNLLIPVAITSLNRHGAPSIVAKAEAEAFCRQYGIGLVVHYAGLAPHRGSYPIVEIGPEGALLIRAGNQPKKRMLALLPRMVDASD